MTGWIIFGSIMLLLSLPLFIPLRLRVGLDKERRDWTVHVATLQVAPEGEKHWQEFRTRWGRRWKPLRIVGGWLIRAALFLLSGLALAGQGILWLFSSAWQVLRWPFTALRRRSRNSKKPGSIDPGRPVNEEADDESAAEFTSGAPSAEEDSAPVGRASLPAEEEPEASTPEPPTPPGQPDSGEARAPNAEFSSDMKSGSKDPGHPGEPPSNLYEDLDDFGEDSQPDFEDEDKSAEKRSLIETIRLGFSMLEAYGPVGKRILSIVFGFIGDILRVPRWRQFEGRLEMGGDPAAMGALLGWQHAIMGAIDPRLHRHLHFEPDFDDPDRPVSGSLDFDVVIWPYRFVWPTLRLIIRIPWIGLIRIYRRYRAGTLIPAQNSGVA